MTRWTHNRAQGCYVSPCGRFVAQRASRYRWDLYRLTDPPRLTSAVLLGTHPTLRDAQTADPATLVALC